LRHALRGSDQSCPPCCGKLLSTPPPTNHSTTLHRWTPHRLFSASRKARQKLGWSSRSSIGIR
jgi:hypothetical protein